MVASSLTALNRTHHWVKKECSDVSSTFRGVKCHNFLLEIYLI